MANFFSLPYELRNSIYAEAFGKSNKAILATSRIDSVALLPLPNKSTDQQYTCPRSGQLLRVCRAIYEEALPVLYSRTTFHVYHQVFAGKLPCSFSEVGHPFGANIRHLIWQVDCDMMKHLYEEDLQLEAKDFANLQTLEIRARAETWRDSFLGEECDRERFVKGREQATQYAIKLKQLMQQDAPDAIGVDLVEDRTFLGRGAVLLKLSRHRGQGGAFKSLSANVSQATEVLLGKY